MDRRTLLTALPLTILAGPALARTYDGLPPISTVPINGVPMALHGYDPIYLYPDPFGVSGAVGGGFFEGDALHLNARYLNGLFAFRSVSNRRLFRAEPANFVPLVGGYCLGAMSADRVTSGVPQNRLFISEVNRWAIFGSENGPKVWAAMGSQERIDKFMVAEQNYHRRTGLTIIV